MLNDVDNFRVFTRLCIGRQEKKEKRKKEKKEEKKQRKKRWTKEEHR